MTSNLNKLFATYRETCSNKECTTCWITIKLHIKWCALQRAFYIQSCVIATKWRKTSNIWLNINICLDINIWHKVQTCSYTKIFVKASWNVNANTFCTSTNAYTYSVTQTILKFFTLSKHSTNRHHRKGYWENYFLHNVINFIISYISWCLFCKFILFLSLKQENEQKSYNNT